VEEHLFDFPLCHHFSTNEQPWFSIPVIEEGRAALEKVNKDLGLALDEWDLEYYTKLFVEVYSLSKP